MSCFYYFFFFFKQKTAYEMRISDWSSDVCSSDLMTAEEASKITPLLDWAAFFEALDVPPSDGFSLSQPKFFARFDAMLADVPAAQWRDYLAFHTIDDASE